MSGICFNPTAYDYKHSVCDMGTDDKKYSIKWSGIFNGSGNLFSYHGLNNSWNYNSNMISAPITSPYNYPTYYNVVTSGYIQLKKQSYVHDMGSDSVTKSVNFTTPCSG